MKILAYFFFLLFLLAIVNATSIGVSPEKVYLELSNNTLNISEELIILNPNNETVYFNVKSVDNLIDFSLNNGKIGKNNRKSIKINPNYNLELNQGIYEDLIIVSVSNNNKDSFSKGIGIKVIMNVTQDLANISYYFDNEDDNNNSNEHNKTDTNNLITGMSVFYNGKLKDNAIVNIVIVGIIILLLYYLTKQKN